MNLPDDKKKRGRRVPDEVRCAPLSERALLDSHETLCSILATTRDGYWHVDADFKLIDVNAVYCQQSGYAHEQLLGMPVGAFDAPQSVVPTETQLRGIIANGSGQFESIQRRCDGSTWTAEVSATYRGKAGGEFFLFLRDISERKHAAEVLREQKEFFHLIAENIGDFIAVLDTDGRRLYNSPSYLQFFGMEKETRGSDSFAEIHPDDRERVKQAFTDTVQSGVGRRLSYRFVRADGSVSEMESSGNVIRDRQGRVARVVVVSHDVTERRRAERALKASEEFKNTVLNSIAAEIAVLDRDGIIQAVNERWRRFAQENSPRAGQLVAGTEVGSNYLAVCAADPAASAAHHGIRAVLDGRLPIYHAEYACHSALRQRWFSLVATPLGKDCRHGVVITHSDITALKQAERYEQFRSRVLELLADGKPLAIILDALVRGVERIEPATLCGVFLLDGRGQNFQRGIAPSLPVAYLDAIEGMPVGTGNGSCSMAAYTGERVIVEDISEHPFWARLRDDAAQAGLGACWSQPIRAASGQILGTFAIYHRQPHAPLASDLAIIEQSARLASIAIERNLAEERLKESAAHYRLLTEDVADVVWKQDSEHRYTYISPADERLRGYRADEVIGRHFFDFLTSEGVAVASEKNRQREAFEGRGILTGTSTIEVQQRCKDGRLIWVEILTTPERDACGRIFAYHGISRDITERRQMEEQMRQLAFYDPLTKLPNRRLLTDRLILNMAASARSGLYAAVMFIDLDNFKPLNDTHGHEVGDLLLIEVAARMKNCVREMDTVARVGGDEFVVMISELGPDKAESTIQAGLIAEKIRVALAQPYVLAVNRDGLTTVEHHCSASIGVVLFNNHEVGQDDIINRADRAMYEAKESGRNWIRFYEG
jgi:diguanylate cyclase (GGDEF)-like protein/PAS domain S-box-containing protein